MSIGTSILDLMGVQDPRQKLLASIANATAPASAQYATPGAQQDPSATPQDPQAAQRTAPQPEALQSPEDLKQMYADLLKYSSRAENIDRGFGLLGAAFAQPDNRANVMNMFAGESEGEKFYTDPAKIAGLSLELNKAGLQRSQYAAQMAALPALAEKYGIDLPTAQMLLQSGKLDDFVKEREKQQFDVKNRAHTFTPLNGQVFDIDPNDPSSAHPIAGEVKPNTKLVVNPDKTTSVVDMNTGKKVTDVNAPDPTAHIKILKAADGSQHRVNTATGEDLGIVLSEDPKSNIIIVQGPDKSQHRIDKLTGEDLGAVVAGDPTTNQTPQEKNYDRTVEQLRSWNLTHEDNQQKEIPSFDDWMSQHSNKGVTVNNVNKGQNAFDVELGRQQGKRYIAIQSTAENARNAQGMYDIAQKSLDTGMKTGFGADTQNTWAHIYSALGGTVDTSKMAATDVFKSVQNQLALIKRNPQAGLGMPGSLSDKDIQFLKDADINLGASPEANRTMIQIAKRINQRRIDVAEQATLYKAKHHNLDEGFDAELQKWSDANPLFQDLQIAPKTPEQRRKEAFDKYGLKE